MREIDYQNMYRQVCLSDGQKNKIWAGVKEKAGRPAAGKKAGFSLRLAICVCAFLAASGITVLAVNSSYVESIAKAMADFFGKGEEDAQNRTELYEEYGMILGQSGMSAVGEIKLEAALYDRGFLCIPFTLYPAVEATPGSDISSEPTFRDLSFDMMEMPLYYSEEGEELRDLWTITRFDPVVQEDGSLTGSIVIGNTAEEGFAQGGTVKFIQKGYARRYGGTYGRALADGEDAAEGSTYEVWIGGEPVPYVEAVSGEEILAEFQLAHEKVPEMEISTEGMSLPYGIRADKVTISPLALYMHGTADDTHPADKLIYNIWVVLEDGSTVEFAGQGAWDLDHRERGEHEFGFHFSTAFADVVNLEDIAGVRITDRGEEICFIPVE